MELHAQEVHYQISIKLINRNYIEMYQYWTLKYASVTDV